MQHLAELMEKHSFSTLNLLESSQIMKLVTGNIGSTFVSGYDLSLVFFIQSFRYFQYKIIFEFTHVSEFNKGLL